MERHFHEELRELKQELFSMGTAVESAIEKSIEAFLDRNTRLAQEVIDGEEDINKMELAIDDKGHSISALWQPLATDLRLLTAILKINTDLERMGDHAVNIAERTISLKQELPIADPNFLKMGHAVLRTVTDALNAFITDDINLAVNVLKRDDEIDGYNDELSIRLTQLMEKNNALIRTGIHCLIVAHNLERLGDLSNNIAEDVIYMKQGREVRHRAQKEF